VPADNAADGTVEELIEVKYDETLEHQQTVCDAQQIRLAHESQRGREVRKEMNEELDKLIRTAQRKTAG